MDGENKNFADENGDGQLHFSPSKFLFWVDIWRPVQITHLQVSLHVLKLQSIEKRMLS